MRHLAVQEPLVSHSLLLAILAVPNLNLVDILHGQVVDVICALRMYPSTVDALVFSHLAGDHEVRLDSTSTHAVEPSVKEPTILQWDDRWIE